jgi:hypothetical protein
MTTQNHEARAGLVQLDEEIAEVVEQLNHARVRGTNRTVMWARECCVLS